MIMMKIIVMVMLFVMMVAALSSMDDLDIPSE